ncbi:MULTISPECIES: hypothetical protein [unclassified Pseudomonas]|uniref:hypothetical protein n=1 Tax=unclassified Pseudomonas TaxID=196821 RepID=UPI0024486F86|nr:MULTISPECIES: hypothetical protein [unclassified Pseudomonas]MDH0302273.1 hypothetical protein [Pseudomonas sp. GD04091]MDH1985996.1 hypothetical protein [Pseudomonas sp. GD03689]
MTAHHAAQYSIPADWQQFQRLSVAVASAHFGIDFHSYGRNGQGQGGIDSYAYTLDGRLIAIQSKSKDGGYGAALSPGDVTKAVNKARDFKFKIDLFVILTSSPDDTRLSDRALEITQAHQAKGEFAVEVWGWQSIEDVIRRHETIQRSYYPHTATKTSTWHWVFRAGALFSLILMGGYGGFEYVNQRAATNRIHGDTGVGVQRFIQQNDRLSEAYSNCQNEMDKDIFLSSFEFDHYCTMPVGKQLLAMRENLQKIVLDIDPEVFEKMTSMVDILGSYYHQGRRASALTAAYEDVYRKDMLNFCKKQSDHLITDNLRQLLKSAAVQQLEYYHSLSSYIYPSLSAMKAQVIASALIMRRHKVAPSVMAEANELNDLLSQNQAYHLEEVTYPFTLSAVKMMSSPYAGLVDKSGASSEVEALREREVLIGGSLTSYLGHPEEARQIVECGGMKPELIPALEKRERKIEGKTTGTSTAESGDKGRPS